MIDIYLKESNNQKVDLSEITTAPIVIEEQLDTSLDSGTIKYLKTEPNDKELNEALARYSINIGDEEFDFVGMDSRALLRRENNEEGIYSHQISLTEPSKLLQGVMIDGFGVSQPEDYDDRQTLRNVVSRLLNVTPFDNSRSLVKKFALGGSTKVLKALSSVKSPQFKWNTQTSLWECLLQVGAVIDAIPRLVADDEGNYTVVTFDFVNAYADEVDSIYDGATNVFGENVNELQYNTALSSVVENLRESD